MRNMIVNSDKEWIVFLCKSRDFPHSKASDTGLIFVIALITKNDPTLPSPQETQKAPFTYWLPPAMHCGSQPRQGNSALHRCRPLHPACFSVHVQFVRKIKIHLATTCGVSEGHLCPSPLSPRLCTIQ